MRFAEMNTSEAEPRSDPVYRSIFAVDLEGSTRRTNPVKGELRRSLYLLMDRALAATEITTQHLEPPADRGDGMLLLIRPHDDVPKTALLGRLIPALSILLAEHNATVADPSLRMRLRVVIHAGEVHLDNWGFYGEDLDVAFRLLDSPAVKRTLSAACVSPLVLVISDEIFRTIVRHGYLDEGQYEPLVRVRVADQERRGWVCTPPPAAWDQPLTIGETMAEPPSLAPVPAALAIAPAGAHSRSARLAPERHETPGSPRQDALNPRFHAPRSERQRARRASIRAGITSCRSPMTA
jgi:hypothetical protein